MAFLADRAFCGQSSIQASLEDEEDTQVYLSGKPWADADGSTRAFDQSHNAFTIAHAHVADGSERFEVPNRGHGDYGHVQPHIRKEHLKLGPQCKRSKGDGDEEFKAAQPDKCPFTPAQVNNVSREIPEDEIALLGPPEEYARPDWMTFMVLPVRLPPVCSSISTDGGALRSEDDLTYKPGTS
ncbi:RNA polymerase II largest subunit [Sanghuangporus baumii]|uniref:DNA-directed RNA polymerase n=1 Tax=Sanghuangporus baumii TaxID=108892 RepID=A0A9Q5I0S6_SANBA|nr:RNA polymerase II largest subunit [Sanghuangporus baumii]